MSQKDQWLLCQYSLTGQNINTGRCLLETNIPQQNCSSKPRFNTWTKFQDFMDRSGFSSKYKTKNEYNLIKGE